MEIELEIYHKAVSGWREREKKGHLKKLAV